LAIGEIVTAGQGDNPFPPWLCRHQLAQDDADTANEVEWTDGVASIEGTTIFTASPTTVAMTPEVRARFVRFLRHRFAGHPSIHQFLLTRTPTLMEFSQLENDVRIEVL